MIMLKQFFMLMTLTVFLTACQTLPKPAVSEQTSSAALQFLITGKIGITTQTADGKQAASAFYTWHQDDKRFAIDLTGALGIGATAISFDGQNAKLISESVPEMTADSPEALLYKATGWQAPISQLPYWIVGKTAPEDTQSTFQEGRLMASTHQEWSAVFAYPKNSHRPNRLTMTHLDGHKVVMTIAYP